MARIERWEKLKCGATVRSIIVTWNRAEFLARLQLCNTLAHKKVVVRDYHKWKKEQK